MKMPNIQPNQSNFNILPTTIYKHKQALSQENKINKLLRQFVNLIWLQAFKMVYHEVIYTNKVISLMSSVWISRNQY